MSQFTSAMRAAVATAALIGGYAWTCPATATADSNSAALAKMLSKGYTTSNCQTQDPDQDDEAKGTLAGYQCGQNSLPGGPVKGMYVLYDDANGTSQGFNDAINGLTRTPCASDNPDAWHYKSSPDTTAGKLFCGTGKSAFVAWTNDANEMVGMVAGSDVESLYQWWLQYG